MPVQKHLGNSFPAWVFFHILELDPLVLLVPSDIVCFLLGGVAVFRPSGTFLLQLEPSINILGKETCSAVFWSKVEYLVDIDDLVTLFHHFLDLRRAPGPAQHSLFSGMAAHVRPFQEWFLHFFLHTATAEGKCELASFSHWEDRMKEALGRENIHFRYAKVVVHILVSRVEVRFREPHRIGTVLVDTWVKGSEVHLVCGFSLFRFGVQGGCPSPSPKEGVSRFEWCHDLEGFKERLQLRIIFKLAPPFLYHRVARDSQHGSLL